MLKKKENIFPLLLIAACAFILLTGDIKPVVPLLLAPVVLTAAAKLYSNSKGAEGKMSHAYKNEHTRNKRFYRLFCGLLLIMPIAISAQNAFHFDTFISISTKVENIISVIYLIPLCTCLFGWTLTELIRKNDFPWGIFRLVERLVYAILLAVGTYVVLTLVFSIFKEYPTLGQILGLIGMFAAFVLFLVLANLVFWWMVELVMIIFGVKYAKRKALIEEWKTAFESPAPKTEWEEASSHDWLGREYRKVDSWGNTSDLRRRSDGIFIDRSGNQYKKETFWDMWKNA